jgi:hypothetical protein
VPRQTEHTDQDSMLPQPELNPLINPVLGQHMGRWAEVYFTAAPENREEAVLALLRELTSETASKPAEPPRKANFGKASLAGPDLAEEKNVAQSSEALPGGPLSMPSERKWVEAIEENLIVCGSCGRQTPEAQRFCGMCGAPMREPALGSNVKHLEESPAEEFYPVDVDDIRETVFSFGGNVPASDNSVPYRYRVYVLAGLLALIAALVIMAYRGTQDWSGRAHSLPQAAPSASPEPTAQPGAKPDMPPQTPAANDSKVRANADSNSEPKAERQKSGALLTAPKQPTSRLRNDRSATQNPVPTAAGQGNGSEELQVAERYLNGAHGNARDSREGARWLWQAVGKQNATASVLLSDLYLRGDGVPKNCDQARLLLDAAARKGAPGAGQRLRNLQAFGCQ